MSFTIGNYKGYPIFTPDPTAGSVARVVNDGIKDLIDTSVQTVGQFPATNFFGATAHFSRNDYQYFYCETASPGWGGLFPAIAQSTNINYCFDTGEYNYCNDCGFWCNPCEQGTPFILCVVNAKYITKLGINLQSFQINPVSIQSFTALTVLKLQEFTMTNSNLLVSELNDLSELSMHIKLSGSSTITINNLSSLTSLWMSGDSYGGMHGLTDANFTLDISTLPSLSYIVLADIGTGISTAWIDTFFIALAASVLANPRTGFVAIDGTNNSVSSVSSSARTYLSGPGGWSLSYNS